MYQVWEAAAHVAGAQDEDEERRRLPGAGRNFVRREPRAAAVQQAGTGAVGPPAAEGQ